MIIPELNGLIYRSQASQDVDVLIHVAARTHLLRNEDSDSLL